MKVVEQTYEWLAVADKPLINRQDKINKLNQIKEWLLEEINETIAGIENDDEDEIINGAVDALVICSNIPYYLGISLEALETECNLVKLSNDTKYCKTLEEALESKRRYDSGTHPNKFGTVIKTIVETSNSNEFPYIVKRQSDSKLLKSINFKDVKDLKQ